MYTQPPQLVPPRRASGPAPSTRSSTTGKADVEATVWCGIDAMWCINLRTRPDRRATATAQFEKVGLSKRMKFFLAEKSSMGGFVGCYESHRSCIQQAYDDGCNTVAVFEDDVEFNDGWQQVVTDTKDFIARTPSDKIDLILLGGRANHVHEDCGALWRASAILAHAYVMTRSGMRRFLDRMPVDYDASRFNKIPHDMAWGLVLPGFYLHKNLRVIDQSWTDTDNPWFSRLTIDPRTANWMQTKLSVKALTMQASLIVALSCIPALVRHNLLVMTQTPVAMHPRGVNDMVYVCKGGMLARMAFAITVLASSFWVDAPPKGYMAAIVGLAKGVKMTEDMGNSIDSGMHDAKTIHRKG